MWATFGSSSAGGRTTVPSAAYVVGLPAHNAAVVYLTNVAVRGLAVGAPVVRLALGHDDALLACFGVRPYDAAR